MVQPPATVEVVLKDHPRLDHRTMNLSEYEAIPKAKRPKLYKAGEEAETAEKAEAE